MIAVTWWGHASATVELAADAGSVVRVATDPLLPRRLFHLARAAAPAPAAAVADVVLVSHLHHDHLHVPSLARFAPGTRVVLPRGALDGVRGLRALGERLDLAEAATGDALHVAGLDVEVLAAHHDGSRDPLHRSATPALGFRFGTGAATCWYPGDTGPAVDLAAVAPVDLALVPIGGWGPSLGEHHLDPGQAAGAVARVGARAALAVHYGTFWPVGLRRVHPASHEQLFVTPPARFREALAAAAPGVAALTPAFGERVVV